MASWMNYLPIDMLQGFKEAVLILCQKHLWHRNATRKHFGGSCQTEFSSTVAVPSRSSSAKSKRTAGSPALAACGVMDALPGYAESAESLHAHPTFTRTTLEAQLTVSHNSLS